MAERIPYVGPRQANFSLPQRLGHKHSVSLLPTQSQLCRESKPASKLSHGALCSGSRPIPPRLRASSTADSPSQPVPSSPTHSNAEPSSHFLDSEPQSSLRARPTSTSSSATT